MVLMAVVLFTTQLAYQLGCPKIVLDHVCVWIYMYITCVCMYMYMCVHNAQVHIGGTHKTHEYCNTNKLYKVLYALCIYNK